MSREADLIAALPRTFDGAAVVPGMKIWHSYYEGVREATVTEIGTNYIAYADPENPGIPFGGEPNNNYMRTFSSREAAEADALFRDALNAPVKRPRP
jgi:hypothetical protein